MSDDSTILFQLAAKRCEAVAREQSIKGEIFKSLAAGDNHPFALIEEWHRATDAVDDCYSLADLGEIAGRGRGYLVRQICKVAGAAARVQ